MPNRVVEAPARKRPHRTKVAARKTKAQLGLTFEGYDATRARAVAHPNWGGKRAGAGRKPKGLRAGVSHSPRAAHVAAHPVHVTMRALRTVPGLTTRLVFPVVREAIGGAQRADFRIVHFSVQRDHLHLLVEARSGDALRAGLQGLAIRVARAVNRAGKGRKGKVWADRHHTRALTSPREVRNALVYILQNHQKHARGAAQTTGLDPFSSARWFDGFTSRAAPALATLAEGDAVPCPVLPAKTWLARVGWRKHRLIDPGERPAANARVPKVPSDRR